MRRRSLSFVIREKHIEITTREHCTAVRTGRIKSPDHTKYLKERGVTGTLIRCRWECNIVQPLWKPISYKAKHISTTLNAILFLGVY